MKKFNVQNILFYAENIAVLLLIIASTFVFVKPSINVLEFYIWFNLFTVICVTIYKPKNNILSGVYFYVIEPVKRFYLNYRFVKKINTKIILGINILFILILVAAGWFVCSAAYLLTTIITNKLYEDVIKENDSK